MKNLTVLKKKKGWKGVCFSKPMLLVLLVLAFFLGRGAVTMFMRSHNAEDRLKEEQIELQRAQERHDKLSGDLEMLRTDFGKEALLREKYDVVKPGEEVIKIVNNDGEREVVVEEEKSFFRSAWEFIKFW